MARIGRLNASAHHSILRTHFGGEPAAIGTPRLMTHAKVLLHWISQEEQAVSEERAQRWPTCDSAEHIWCFRGDGILYHYTRCTSGVRGEQLRKASIIAEGGH